MLPSLKPVLCFSDTSITNGGTQTGSIDTLDTTNGIRYDFLALALVEATSDVVSNKPSVLKLSHSDTTDATNYSDISGFVGGTDFTVPSANTSAKTLTLFNVDLRGKKRYIKLSWSPRTTVIAGAWGVLSRGSQAPSNATLAGIKQLIEG
jgi:hypothetical protein